MPDKHMEFPPPGDEEVRMCCERMAEYIIPNRISNMEQKRLFDQAVRYQLDHERTQAERSRELEAMPQGVKSFTIGKFSMTFDEGYSDSGRITDRTICPAARSLLRHAGLLYRGLDWGVSPWH